MMTPAKTFQDRSPMQQAGRLASQDLGNQIVSANWSPDLILSSDAVRSRETVHEMNKSFSEAIPVDYLGSFYLTSSLDGLTRKLLEDSVVAAISNLALEKNAAMHTVLCVGHNKGWEEALSEFVGQKQLLPPASAALLQREANDWMDAMINSTGAWRLIRTLVGNYDSALESSSSK